MNHTIFGSNNTKLNEILEDGITIDKAYKNDDNLLINTYNSLIESVNMNSRVYDNILSNIHEDMGEDFLNTSLDIIKGSISDQCVWLSDRFNLYKLSISANIKLALEEIYKTLNVLSDDMFNNTINPMWYIDITRIERFFDNILCDIKPFDINDNFKWYKSHEFDYEVITRYNITLAASITSTDSLAKIFAMDEFPLQHADGIRNISSVRQMLNHFSYSVKKNTKWLQDNSVYYKRLSKSINSGYIDNLNKFDLSILSKILNAFDGYRNVILNILIVYQKQAMEFLHNTSRVLRGIVKVQ